MLYPFLATSFRFLSYGLTGTPHFPVYMLSCSGFQRQSKPCGHGDTIQFSEQQLDCLQDCKSTWYPDIKVVFREALHHD